MSIFANVLNKIDLIADQGINSDEFEPANNSKWIVGVADDGIVEILSIPNIHHSYKDLGRTAEEFGMPETVDDAPGVYEWTCRCWETRDYETGYVDDWGFEPINRKLLFTWKNQLH